ncbi:MAG: histidine--tRNA ligase, partial [Deltaproteobacteria bacterium]|nr:histidine--tRNA ligase [Deltaproteobacteria bacterium]
DRLLKDGVGYRDIKAFIAGDNIGDAGCLELDVIEQTLQAYGIPEKNYAIDITLARGLDYYTGPIFETIVKEPRIGSITGGGRYDNLIGLFSKNQLPATGTSFGLERIITVMEELGRDEQQAAATTVLIALFSNDMMPAVAQLAGSMRNAAISTEVYFEPAKLKKQFSYASSRNMPFVLVLGPDEAEKNLVTIKDMSSGAQETIPQGDAVTKLAGLMKS